jgi:hypothetical protein
MSPRYIELHCHSSFSFRPKLRRRCEGEARRESAPLTTSFVARCLSLGADTHSLAHNLRVGRRLAPFYLLRS